MRAYPEREDCRTACAADDRIAPDLHRALRPDGTTRVIMVAALDKDIDRLQALRIPASTRRV